MLKVLFVEPQLLESEGLQCLLNFVQLNVKLLNLLLHPLGGFGAKSHGSSINVDAFYDIKTVEICRVEFTDSC